MRYIFLMVSLATLVSAAFAHEGATGIVKDRMGKFKESQLILKLMIKSAKVDDFEKIADMSSALHQWGSEMTDYFPAGSDETHPRRPRPSGPPLLVLRPPPPVSVRLHSP